MSDVHVPEEGVFPLAEILGVTSPEMIEVIDVGAMLEGQPRYSSLLRQGKCRITGFEANREQIPAAEAGLPEGSQILPYALGDGGPATLNITLYRGCSSLFEPNPAVIDMFEAISATSEGGNFRVVGQQEIQTVRLDDIPECPHADYVKLDVQGDELMVLENGMEKLSKALVIETEVEFVEIYKGQPLFADIQSFMVEQGFVLHKMIDISGRNFRPISTGNRMDAISQFLWADAVFVRDFTRLDLYAPLQLLTAATILHDVYYSYDLVHLYLQSHDRIAGTPYAEAYRAGLARTGNLPRQFANIRTEH